MPNTYELCQQIIANGFLPDAHANYSLNAPFQLIKELRDTITQNIQRPVVNARQGYWLRSTLITTVSGTARYLLPHRAAAGGYDRIEFADSATGDFRPLDGAPNGQALAWERTTQTGMPMRFAIRGNYLTLFPTPDASTYVVRVWYYVRPSKLVAPQSPTLTGNSTIDAAVTDRGRITALALGSRQVVVNAIPFRMDQTTPAAIVTAVDRVDVIKPNGWFETVLVGATQTISGGTFIVFGGSDPVSDIEVGDYVRAADETDWPCIPADFHRLIADLSTLPVLTQLNYLQKAAVFGEKCGGDMDRFRDLLEPRTKDQAQSIDFPDHVFGGGNVPARRGAWGA